MHSSFFLGFGDEVVKLAAMTFSKARELPKKEQYATADKVLSALPKNEREIKADAAAKKQKSVDMQKSHIDAKSYMKSNPQIFHGIKPNADTGRASYNAEKLHQKTMSSGMSAKDIVDRYAVGKGSGGKRAAKTPVKKELPAPKAVGPKPEPRSMLSMGPREQAKARVAKPMGIPSTHRGTLAQSYYKTRPNIAESNTIKEQAAGVPTYGPAAAHAQVQATATKQQPNHSPSWWGGAKKNWIRR